MNTKKKNPQLSDQLVTITNQRARGLHAPKAFGEEVMVLPNAFGTVFSTLPSEALAQEGFLFSGYGAEVSPSSSEALAMEGFFIEGTTLSLKLHRSRA